MRNSPELARHWESPSRPTSASAPTQESLPCGRHRGERAKVELYGFLNFIEGDGEVRTLPSSLPASVRSGVAPTAATPIFLEQPALYIEELNLDV